MKKQGRILSAIGLCSSLLLFSAHPAWANNAQASTTAKASVAAPSASSPSSKPKKKITSSRTRATLQPKLYSYQAPGKTPPVTKLPGNQLPANAIVPKVVVLPGSQLPTGAIVPTAKSSSRNTAATITLPPLQITPAQEPALTTVAPPPKKAHPNSVPGEDPAWGDYQYHR